ncbi:prolactin-releasing peptide receptor-like [Coccinella septempunctata]|uniref:prolactin-releasing peptide receptor-like n=1 Tax=Coccinella septempunctata TaxID=41139 RepID=UPI001D08BB31|nr:prolactin-releasing peptide receptor-like [Coccinella septempunctata]XP_044763010.1 prolactin-releasing peptide receptor-like [Coccinella septempunctata]
MGGDGVPVNNNRTEMNVTSYNYDLIDNNLVQVVFLLVYTSIFVLGIFGNVLVCYVVIKNKAMQTVTNLFITNLALSDILLCIFAVPFTPIYTFLGKWIFGSLICHLLTFVQSISVYISTLTLTSIAIDRYLVIIYPFHPRMKLTTCIIIIVTIWIFAILVTLPYGYYTKHVVGNATKGGTKYYCEESWPNEGIRKIFGGITSTMQFAIPFLVMAYCYICVSVKLNDRAKSKPGSKTSKKEEADRERKRRTNRMLIAMVAIFLISWMPLNTVNVIFDFYTEIDEWEYSLFIFFLVHAIAMSSTCYNPFLYAWLNENFRKEFKLVLPCFDKTATRMGPRITNCKSDRTCEANIDTQRTLISSRKCSTVSLNDRKINSPPIKVDSVEVENVLITIPSAIYDPLDDTVRLRLITEEDASYEPDEREVNKK